MEELKLLNYCTVYSYSSIDARGNKHLVFSRGRSICFASLFGHLRSVCPKGEYTLFVSTDTNIFDIHGNNYCFLDKAGIIRHLKQAQQVVPEFLEFTLTPSEYGGYSGYEITLIIDRANKIVHKYVLTWARYLYESSFSLALLDVTRLAKLPKFRFISYANLLNVVQACFPVGGVPNRNSWHAIGSMRPHAFLTRKELSQTLPNKESLNELYPFKDYDPEMIPVNPNKYKLDYWKSEESFISDRLPVYEKLFNKLKETDLYEILQIVYKDTRGLYKYILTVLYNKTKVKLLHPSYRWLSGKVFIRWFEPNTIQQIIKFRSHKKRY